MVKAFELKQKRRKSVFYQLDKSPEKDKGSEPLCNIDENCVWVKVTDTEMVKLYGG